MVHHIRANEDQFVSPISAKTENKEHIYAFITGMESKDVRQLLLGLVSRWQDITKDHLVTSSGMTSRLFIAAVLSQYGSLISETIRDSFKKLRRCDVVLLKATKDTHHEQRNTDRMQSLNRKLTKMNKKLTGTRSIMHYLSESANILVDKLSPFEKYVEARIDDWDNSPDLSSDRSKVLERLKYNFKQLDIYKEKIRDNDKLTMVGKCMLQYKTDIKALQ